MKQVSKSSYTLVENLTVGIVAGCLLAAVFAIYNRAIPD
jgi:hypothetical protein